MNTTLTIEGTTVSGTLEDSAAGRDFASLLPLTLTLSDFHETERIADLPRRLTLTGAPAGTEGRAGDIAYYAPWGNLALFYADAPYAEGLVRLGRLGGSAARVLADLPEPTTVTIALADEEN